MDRRQGKKDSSGIETRRLGDQKLFAFERALYLLSLVAVLTYSILYNSMLRSFIPFQGKWSLISCGFLAVSELLTLHRVGFKVFFQQSGIIVGICSIVVSLVVTFSCGASAPFIICFFVFGARRFSFDDIARTALITIASSCVLIVACSAIGIIDDVVWVQGDRVRHGLGMRYTTTLSHYVLYCTLLQIYLRRSNLSISQTVAILSVDIAVFLLTNSRNSFGLTIIALVFAWIVRSLDSEQLCKKLSLLFTAIIPFFAVISIALMVVYSPNVGWQSKLNSFFGGRLEISHRSYQLYGIKPFGQDQEFVGQGIEDDGQKYDGPVTVIDNSYCNMLITKGSILTFMVIVALSILIWEASSNGSVVIVLIFLLVATHSLTDPQLLTLQFDVPLLLVGPCLLGTEETRANELLKGIPSQEPVVDTGWKRAVALGVSAALLIPAYYIHSMDALRPAQGIKVVYSVEPSEGTSTFTSESWASVISYNDFEVSMPDASYQSGELHIEWNALLSPLTSGVYEFAADGEGSVVIVIDGQTVLADENLSLFNRSVSNEVVELRAGSYHPFRVVWINNNSGNSLHLYWRTVGNTEWHVIPYNCYSLPQE